MTLSRTARILIALLLVAAAAFFWVNFFRQPQEPAGLLSQPTVVPGAAAADASLASPTAAATPPEGGTPPVGGTPPEGGTPAEGGTAAAAGTPVVAAGTQGVTVAAPGPAAAAVASPAPGVVTPPTVVLRDLVVDDLPFLVASPPVAEDSADETADAAGGATRPQGTRRGNINPFSPVVLQEAPAAPAPVIAAAAPSAEPNVVVVDTRGQSGPAAPGSAASTGAGSPQGPLAQAPAPRAVAPAPNRAAAVPRPLPGGTLPITPDLLRDTRTVTAAPSGPANLAEVAAVRVPAESARAALPAATTQTTADSPASVEVLGPGQPTAEAAKASSSTANLPLVVGADPLSRYLRDHDVRFTGTALGPLSVGVFRAKQFEQPVVLTLGQTLPDTDIVLADLRGYEAKFSLGDNTQVLSLDIRR